MKLTDPLLAQPTDPVPAPRRKGPSSSETVLLVSGVVLFCGMIYEMGQPLGETPFLNPILLAVAGTMVLWPIRSRRAARTLRMTGAVLLILWLLNSLSVILLPFVSAFVLGYLFNPITTQLHERFKIPRWASALAVTVFVVGLVALFFLLVVPSLYNELDALVGRAANAMEKLRVWLATTPMLDRFEESGYVDREALIGQSIGGIQAQIDTFTSNLPDIAQNIVGYLGSLLGAITLLAIVPVVLYYTLKDYPLIAARVAELFPTFGGHRDYLERVSNVVGSYLRGQVLISAIAAFNVALALWLLDVPFALLLGLIGGVLNMVPTLGALVTGVVGLAVALVFSGPVAAVSVIGVLLAQNLLEQSVLSPLILGRQVGLHPVMILLSLLVFGFFLGLLGLIIAVPATALVVAAYEARRHELTLELSSDARLKQDLARRLSRREAAQNGTGQNGTAQNSTAQNGTAQNSAEALS